MPGHLQLQLLQVSFLIFYNLVLEVFPLDSDNKLFFPIGKNKVKNLQVYCAVEARRLEIPRFPNFFTLMVLKMILGLLQKSRGLQKRYDDPDIIMERM